MFSRCVSIRVFVQAVRRSPQKPSEAFLFASPDKRGKRSAEGAHDVSSAVPVARHGRDPLTGPLAFRRSTTDRREFPPAPARATLPGITGSTAKRASPAPVQLAPSSPVTRRTVDALAAYEQK